MILKTMKIINLDRSNTHRVRDLIKKINDAINKKGQKLDN